MKRLLAALDVSDGEIAGGLLLLVAGLWLAGSLELGLVVFGLLLVTVGLVRSR